MRRSIRFLLCGLLLALLLTACGSSPDLAAPRVRVNGYLYYNTVAQPEETLPEGYALAGTLKRVRHLPREDMTALNIPDGSELYTCPTASEAVYIRVPNRDGYSLYRLNFLPPTQMPGGSSEG